MKSLLSLIALTTVISSIGCESIEARTVLNAEQAKLFEVNSYYSAYSFGPTKKFYIFEQDNVVLKLNFPNQSEDISVSGTLLVFDKAATPKDLSKWLNNQHSDGLYADAAQPTQQVDVNKYISIETTESQALITGNRGEIYHPYTVNFHISDIVIDGVTLQGFDDAVTVNVLVKDSSEELLPEM